MEDRENKVGYYAIIPATIRYDNNLSANAKLLYGEITALCNKEGYCWASNQYFADLYYVHKDTISSWVSLLKECGYIEIEVTDRVNRKIYIIEDRQKRLGGTVEMPIEDRQKRLHNNTVNNTKIITKAKLPVSSYSKTKKQYYSRFGKKGSMEAIIFNDEVKKMSQSRVKGYEIIGAYMSFREETLKKNIRTKGQLYEFCQRHIKDANKLTAWDDKQLDEAFEKADKEHKTFEWTLSTLLKDLTK